MTIYHILMFIAGGCVSAIIFYPRKKKAVIGRIEYMTTILSFQYHSGIYAAQHKDPPMFEDESQVQLVSLTCQPFFKPSAEHVLETLDKL